MGCATTKKKSGKARKRTIPTGDEREIQAVKDILLAPPLSNFDIDDTLVNIKHYRGCFAKDHSLENKRRIYSDK